MGYMSVPSFINLGSCIYELHYINCLYHNVWPKANFLLFTKINMLLHDPSWIPIIMQSFTPLSFLVFEMRLSKLNNNNNNNNKNFESKQLIMLLHDPS